LHRWSFWSPSWHHSTTYCPLLSLLRGSVLIDLGRDARYYGWAFGTVEIPSRNRGEYFGFLEGVRGHLPLYL